MTSEVPTNESAKNPHIARLIKAFRDKLVDLTLRNRLLNYRHSEVSNTHIRIVDRGCRDLIKAISDGRRLEFIGLPTDTRDMDEKTPGFLAELASSELTDPQYLEAIKSLNSEGTNDPSTQSEIERALKDRLREKLGLGPRRSTRPDTPQAIARAVGINPSYDLDLSSKMTYNEPLRTLQTLFQPDRLEAKLGKISDSAKRSIEESGVNRLYLALGFLEWREARQSNKSLYAPLLVTPVTIEREASNNRWSYFLRGSGDQAFQGNIALKLRLRNENIDLPDLEDDMGNLAYLDLVQEAVKNKEGWAIHNFVTVGLFSFANIEMWNDLDPSNWSTNPLENNQGILSILGGGASSPTDYAEEYDVDSPEVRSATPPLVLNADSSQMSAIIDAMTNRNLAIKGPPGTGKSQTIANLIAAAMYEGKKVLFLAEKMAALDVVKSRLDEVGLGQFILELHSSKSRMQNVLAGLNLRNRRAQAQNRAPGNPNANSPNTYQLDQLESLRQQLNDYANLINLPAYQSGKTIHDVLWACRNRNFINAYPRLRDIEIDKPSDMNPVDVENCKSSLDIYCNSVKAIESEFTRLEDHPWSWVQTPLDPISRERLINNVQDYLDCLSELETLTDALAEFGFRSNLDSPKTLKFFSDCINDIPPLISDVLPELLDILGDDHIKQVLSELHETLIKRDTLLEYLKPLLDTSASLESTNNMIDHMGRLPAEINPYNVVSPEISVREISDVQTANQKMIEQAQRASDLETVLCDFFNVPTGNTGRGLNYLIDALELICGTRDESLELRYDHLKSRSSLEDLRKARERSQALLTMQQELDKDFFMLTLVDPPDVLLAHATVLKTSNIFSPIFKTFRNAKRKWVALSRTPGPGRHRKTPSKSPFLMAQDLERLASYVQRKNEFTTDSRLKELVPVNFKGIYTDLDVWVEAASFMNASVDLSVRDEDMGFLVAQKLQQASFEELLTLKFYSAHAGLNEPKSIPEQISLGDTETLEEKLFNLYRSLEWCAKFSDLNDTVKILNTTSLAKVKDILNISLEFQVLQELISTPGEASGILSPLGLDPDKLRNQLQASLSFATKLSEVFPASTSWSPEFLFSNQFQELVDQLSEINSEITNCLTREQDLLGSIKDVATENITNILGDDNRSFSMLRSISRKSSNRPDSLASWIRVLEASHQCGELNLSAFISEYSNDFNFPLSEGFEAVYYLALCKRILSDHPILGRFSGESQSQAQAQFRDVDQAILQLNSNTIASKLYTNRINRGQGSGPRKTWTDFALIEVLLPQTRPRVKTRDLIDRAGTALQGLQPCFMMSPNSVAQYLKPGSIEFDLLIIDEASQMKPQEALGAIARSRQSVIVGDPMQLPPTSFFNRVDTLEEDLEEDLEDESILDRALPAYSPSRELRWHYRSRHHDLIRFSNKHFYEDRLILFPSPSDGESNELGVRYTKIDATYMGKGANPEEAKQVALATIRAIKEKPDWSVGVVAVNAEQTDLIRTEFDQLLVRDREAQKIWQQWENTLMPGFIKNLENVQGDERDRIIISTTFGPNSNGRVMQRFGPIVQQNGHRRLNVLYTRAKRRVDVYSSMAANDITVDERSSRGVRAFHGYLDYAATLRLDSGTPTTREPDSEFEIFVAGALSAAGFEVTPQVGAGTYFLDIGVKHPAYPHGFLAGIECDGAMYHSARSAKDRDALRQAVLEDMGWTIYRVWSTDWFNDPQSETDKLVTFLNELIREKGSPS